MSSLSDAKALKLTKTIGPGVPIITPWSGIVENTGTSLTELTVIVTVAAALGKPSLSVARNVKLSKPLKFEAGVYVRLGAVPVNVPPFKVVVGVFHEVIVPSTSLAVKAIATGVSSLVVTF